MNSGLLSVLFFVFLVYPFWGLPLLVLLAKAAAARGTTSQRLVWATLIASVATPIFTPIAFGTEGFGIFVPLPFLLLETYREHMAFFWPLAALTFAIAFVVNLRSGEAVSS